MGGWMFLSFLIPPTSTVSVVAPGWEERTDWPDDYPRPPKSERSLFYIQRNLNANTIVYDIDVEEGVIRQRHPINAVSYTHLTLPTNREV